MRRATRGRRNGRDGRREGGEGGKGARSGEGTTTGSLGEHEGKREEGAAGPNQSSGGDEVGSEWELSREGRGWEERKGGRVGGTGGNVREEEEWGVGGRGQGQSRTRSADAVLHDTAPVWKREAAASACCRALLSGTSSTLAA